MKAFLLAAGLGTRLRPLTDNTPKCMLPVAGKPMIDIWLDALAAAEATEVLVNTHHLADVVQRHVAQRHGHPTVRCFFEPRLLGSAGTLAANRDWVGGEEVFLVCYADNLTDFDLQLLLERHGGGRQAATVAVFHAPEPSQCGIVELDEVGVVTSFVEKPEHPASDLANAGIYAFRPEVLAEIEGPPPLDIAFHLMPGLVGRAVAVEIEGYFRDIGTAEAYRLAQLEWAEKVA